MKEVNKDFYWLLPDHIKTQLEAIIQDFSANSRFDLAWEELRKMYRNLNRRSWRDARTVVLDVLNGSTDSPADVEPNEPVTEATQTEAVAERSEEVAEAADILQASEDDGEVVGEVKHKPEFRKHKPRRY